MMARPQLARNRAEFAQIRQSWDSEQSVAVVMTMGALHIGHERLIQQARTQADRVIVTIFLNPLQFAVGEDLSKYPQTLPADLDRCAAQGVDLVFAPAADVIYPAGQPAIGIDAGPLGDVLEGHSRPGHFAGMLTVVAKLLHLTQPQFAFFGQKDAQQLLLIRRMVGDLDFPVQVISVPTAREPDGLARSSRNIYLSASDRQRALVLFRALAAGAQAAAQGPSAVRRRARSVLAAEPLVLVDYLVLIDPQTLAEVPQRFTGQALLAVAARVGTTRLIDNMLLTLGTPGTTS
jgi:pantoate--beta-alanine ligase